MTRKVFWLDPYLTQLDTQITSVAGSDVTVDQTIFYAFSGGQDRDHGTLGTYPVLDARKDGHEIIYSLQADHTLKSGDQVQMCIDWERRYKLMRLHFAAEIVLALVYQQLSGIEKIGAHIAEDKSRIDFLWHENLAQYFPTIATKTEELIAANHAIVSAFSDEANERRYWEIEGFARVPCGGTHLRTTGEVGKGKERVEITLAS